MEPIIVSQADYEAGNYPKDTPIMVGVSMTAHGRGGMNVGKKDGTKITVRLKSA